MCNCKVFFKQVDYSGGSFVGLTLVAVFTTLMNLQPYLAQPTAASDPSTKLLTFKHI